jgi:hypothetical protein
MTHVANAKPAAGPDLPLGTEKIAVLDVDSNKVFLVGHATGVQIYNCDGKAWTFVAPRADLFDDKGKLVATHFAGPTWQTKDGSKVVGSVQERATPDPTAIPWLRLGAASTTPGQLGNTTFIQRVNTKGGVTPAATECSQATVNTQKEVPYSADYYFWKRTGKPGS